MKSGDEIFKLRDERQKISQYWWKIVDFFLLIVSFNILHQEININNAIDMLLIVQLKISCLLSLCIPLH